MRSPDVRVAARRVLAARAVLLFAFAALSARAAHLTVVDDRGLRRGVAQTDRVITLAAERGIIVDRSGAELALSVDAPSVYVVPSSMKDVDATLHQLARALGIPQERLAARLRGRDSFVFLSRWTTKARAERVRALGLPGVGVLSEPRRDYPHAELAASVLGIANIDGIGVRGVEQQEDMWLRGTPRSVPVERDARGRLLVSGQTRGFSTAGGDVALTLDAALQADASAALRDAIAWTGAKRGLVVSMEVGTGDILTLVEAPSFDPNRFRETPFPATRSRAFLDAAEPGSTFKPFIVAAALEHGIVGPDDVFDCEHGTYALPGKTIRDSHPYDDLTVRDIVRLSSNIGAAKIAFALGASAQFEMLERFGFGRTTQSGFPGESAGMLRPYQSWRVVDQANIAFGQGVSVTAVQLAAATAALANGGEWVQPRITRARRAAGGPWQLTGRGEVRFVLRPATAALALELLEGVVTEGGTGRMAALEGVRVAGKTGTAQKFDAVAGRYSEDRFVAWFAGAVPADDPRYVIVVALDEPERPRHTGGAAAAPVFARTAASHLARDGIVTRPVRPVRGAPATHTVRHDPSPEPALEPTAPVSAVVPAVAAAPPAIPSGAPLTRDGDRVLLPDFQGLTVAEVQHATARSPLVVEVSGSGRAVEQDPPPGTVVEAPGARVQVRFEPLGGET